MSERQNINDLEIVGFANVLADWMLPCIVPPVFRLKSDVNRVFLPPYHMNGDFLYDATEVPGSEAAELAGNQEITLWNEPLLAHPDFELWVDVTSKIHYEPIAAAELKMQDIYTASMIKAEQALEAGNLEDAERYVNIAASADDRKVDPFVLKTAIRTIQEDKAGAELMAHLAGRFITPEGFEAAPNILRLTKRS